MRPPRSTQRLAFAALACLALSVAGGHAFIRATLSTTDATPLRWDLEETLQPVASVVGGEILYVVDSAGSSNIPAPDAGLAVARAFEHWEGVGTSRVAFSRSPDAAVQAANNDGTNLVYWAEAAKTPIGGVNTNVTGFVSMTPVFSVATGPNKGLILDANIILNGRQFTWTINPDANPTAWDVEAVVTHEIGHFIGLDHSPVLGSTMGPRYLAGESRQRTLKDDDTIGASEIYPDGDYGISTGAISGAVGRPAGVFGALVAVLDSGGTVVQESISSQTGAYLAPGLPTGSYDVYAEPIDKAPASSTNLFDETDLGGIYGATVDPNFFATLYAATSVTAPNTTARAIPVGSIPPAINVAKIGAHSNSAAGVVFRNAPTFAIAGESNVFIGVAGPNLTSTGVFEITGSGITDTGFVETGSVDGEPYVIHSFNFASNAPQGLRSIRFTLGAQGRTYATGAVEVFPNLSMSPVSPGYYFVAPGEVNSGRVVGINPVTATRRGDDIDLEWDDEPAAYGYHIYRGTLAALDLGLYDHQMIPGTVNAPCGVTTSHFTLEGELLDLTPTYYLITAWNNAGEGITGRDSDGTVLPPPSTSCVVP